MRALTTGELLQFWENGLRLDQVERAISLLSVACPERSMDELTKLTIGERDGRLLTLREWTFGQQLESLVTCPTCHQQVELNFDAADVRSSSDGPAAETIVMNLEGYELSVRVPNSEDVAALKMTHAVEQKRQALFNRCLVHATFCGQPVLSEQMPDETMNLVAVRLAEADPQADVQLNVHCPFCSYTWDVAFDIMSFFWNEIEAWACGVLHEVHTLAGAYGWSEREVLGLSATRRQIYLEMVGA